MTSQPPTWWSPDEVLRRLGEGQPLAEIAAKAGKERGFTKRQALADLDAWKASPVWAVRFEAALAVFEKKGGVEVVGTGWYPDFYRAMEATEGEIPAACTRLGISPALVYARIRDRRAPSYDAEFAEQVKNLETVRLSKVRETAINAAIAGDTRAGMKILEAALPELHNAKHEVAISGGLTNTHLHMHLTPEVVAASAGRTKTLLAGRTVSREQFFTLGDKIPKGTLITEVSPAGAVGLPPVIEVPR